MDTRDPRIETFLKKAAAVADSRDKARALCQEELKTIEREYGQRSKGNPDKSRKTRLTKYRNALKRAGLTKYFLTALRLPKVRARALRTDYDAVVVTRGTDQQPIYNHQALIDKAISCLDSPFYGVVLVGLALLSGRRPAELCVTGDFCEENAAEGHVWFVGQAKSRDEELAETPYEIPILCDIPRFLDAWTRFITMRDFTKYASTVPGQSVSPKFNQTGVVFGASYAKHFARLMPPDTTVRNLRDAYGLICFHTRQRPESHVAINLYLKKILGHSDSKGQTAQSYQKYYLAEFALPREEN